MLLTNKECITSGEALQLKDLERSTVFAVHLFLRWVLRTLPTLNDPVPPGNEYLRNIFIDLYLEDKKCDKIFN